MEQRHERFMKRCFELAKISLYKTQSNPVVGAVLVHENRIIGEGWHKRFGGDHAEVEAIKSVSDADLKLITKSTLYVSLEPCCIAGKTPACSDLIIEKGIKKLVISALDPNPQVNGRSVQILKNKGVDVETGILEHEGNDLIKPFKAHLQKRPYVILKFAQSSDAYFGKRHQQVWISCAESQIKVHQWRAQIDAILIGRHTAEIDNPALTVRLVPGKNPIRIILDQRLELSRELNVWSDTHESIFISNTAEPKPQSDRKKILSIQEEDYNCKTILSQLFEMGIHSLLIEGGAHTIKTFVDAGLWDEARIISSAKNIVSGIRAPVIRGREFRKEKIGTDKVSYVYRE